MRRRKPKGIIIFGTLLIVSSVIHMSTLVFERDWYWYNYSYMPPVWILTRFLFSWFQRILGLTAGIGILYLKNGCRRLAIAISWFTMLVLYWKHPYEAFLNHTRYLDQRLGYLFKMAGYPKISFSALTVPALITHYCLDILFCGSLIYYFTRPQIKKHFGPAAKS